MFLFAQTAIVQPERRLGAYAVDGRFLRSHFTFKGSAFFEDVPASGVIRVRLYVEIG